MLQKHVVALCRKVWYHNIESVDENGFVADNQFLVDPFLILASHYIHIGISNIQLVFPLANEFEIFWCPFIKFYQVESYNWLQTIAEEIECLVLWIKWEAKNTANIIKLI